MLKPAAVLLFLLMLQGCSDHLLKDETKTENSGYFADATDCLHRSYRKEQIKVPTGKTMSVIDVPISHDAGSFSACMQYAGHPTPKVDTQTYLTVSRSCLSESQHTENPDDAYAQCVKRSRITVESVSGDKK